MKNLVTLFLSIFLVISIHAQTTTHTFNNAGNWSMASNWQNSLIANDSSKEAIIRADVSVDAPFTVNTIIIHQNDLAARAISSVGANALTINPDSIENLGVINKSNSPVALSISGNIVISNSDSTGKAVIQTNNNLSNSVVFLDNSLLTINTPLKMRNFGGPTLLNGDLAGSAEMSFLATSDVTFGATADNAAFTGGLIFAAATTVVSNTIVPGGFLPLNSDLKCRSNGGLMQINGAHSLEGRVGRQGINNFTIDFNADQGAISDLSILAGMLTLDVDAGVTNLSFANSALETWVGNLHIVGFRESIIRFGTDSTGLIAAQLSQITHDGTGADLMLDGNGFLIYEPIVLPVELSAFSAEVQNQAILLNWSTFTEQNNDFFTLEKATDGQAFEAIGTQQGAGTSTSIQHYELIDQNPLQGLNYYRLIQTDLDGQRQYSHTISVDFQQAIQVSIFPNPMANKLTIQIPSSESVFIQIMNVKGQQVFQQTRFVDGELVIDVSGLGRGVYILEVNNTTTFDKMYVGKLVKI